MFRDTYLRIALQKLDTLKACSPSDSLPAFLDAATFLNALPQNTDVPSQISYAAGAVQLAWMAEYSGAFCEFVGNGTYTYRTRDRTMWSAGEREPEGFNIPPDLMRIIRNR